MSDLGIEFEEEYDGSEFRIRSRKLLGEKTTPTMINFLIDRGVAKTEKQALVIAVVVIILFLGISITIIRNTFVNDQPLEVVDKYGRTIPFDEYVTQIKAGTF